MKKLFSLLLTACLVSSVAVWASPQDIQQPTPKTMAPKAFAPSPNILDLLPAAPASAPRKVKADDNQCGDNLFWEVTDNALTITGSGDMWDFDADAPWGQEITSASLPEGLTSIGDYAFYWCRSLKSINMPSTVERIGFAAFYACTTLPTLNFSDALKTIGNYAFRYCWSMKEVALKDNMSYIGLQAFQRCDSLTTFTATHLDSIGYEAFAGLPELKSISLPEGLQKIEQGAFNSCNNLKVANLPSTVTEVGHYAFSYDSIPTPLYNSHVFAYLPQWYEGAFDVPAGIEIIAGGSFINCKKVSAVTLPASLKEIREQAFGGCDSIQTIVIPNGTELIGDYAFVTCRDLTNVTLSASLTSIGTEAFWGCASLTSIAIPDAVVELGTHTFTNCSNLQSASIGNGVTALGKYTFYGCSNLEEVIGGANIAFIDSFAFYQCQKLSSITLSSDLKHIGYAAFGNCVTINPLTVPDGVETIENYAFYQVKNVLYHGEAEGSPWGALAINATSDGYLIFSDETKTVVVGCDAAAEGAIVVPEGVQVIGQSAFEGCVNITSVSLPNTLDTIHDAAFYGCTKLESVDFGNHVKYIGPGAFYRCSSLAQVALPASLRVIPYMAFQYCTSLTSVSLQEGIEYIERQAFLGCTKLTSFNLPESVTWIGSLALLNTAITNVVRNSKIFAYLPTSYAGAYEVPDGTEWIASAAFYNCNNLTELTLPNSITSIYESAFEECTSLRTINCPNNAPWAGEYVFYNVDTTLLTLNVPDSAAAISYRKSERWQPFIIRPAGLTVPTLEDLTAAGYDIENDLVLCNYFHVRPLEPVVLGGNYNNWSSDPTQCVTFNALPNFDGWYVAVVPGVVYDAVLDGGSYIEAKPVHLKDGEFFDWYFQAGDQYAWLRQGTNSANVGANDAGEAKILYPAKGAYIYDMLYWRHDPNIPVFTYTIQVYSPDTCAEMRPGLIGGVTNWSYHITMPKTQDEHGRTCYTYSFKSTVAGSAYTFIEGHSAQGDWSNPLQQKVDDEWQSIGNFTFPDAQKDTTIIHDFSDNTKYAYQQCREQLTEKNVTVLVKLPAPVPAAVEIIGSFNNQVGTQLTYQEASEEWIAEVTANARDTMHFREASTWENRLVRNEQTKAASFLFGQYWQDLDENSKRLELDLSDSSMFQWSATGPTAIDEITQSQHQRQCQKQIKDGQLLILRGDKTYTLTGQLVK